MKGLILYLYYNFQIQKQMNQNKGPNSPFVYNYNYGFVKNSQLSENNSSDQKGFNSLKQYEYVPIYQPVFQPKTSQHSVSSLNSPQNKNLSVYSSKKSEFSDSLSIAQQSQNQDINFSSYHQTYYKASDKLQPTVISNTFYKRQSNTQNKRSSSSSKQINTQKTYNNLQDKRIEYLQGVYDSFTQFQKTQKVQILKQFMDKNRAQMMKLYNQIYSFKQNQPNTQNLQQNQKKFSQTFSTGQKIRKNSSQEIPSSQDSSNRKMQILKLKEEMQKQKRIFQDLKYDYNYELQIAEGRNLDASRMRQENHLAQMNQTIKELQLQIGRQKRRNEQMSKEIAQLPFYRQWNLMFQESRGAMKLSVKLKEQLQKRLQKIRQLQNNSKMNVPKSNSKQKLKTVIQVGSSKQTSRVKLNGQNSQNFSQKSPDIGMTPIVRRSNSRQVIKRPSSSERGIQPQVKQNYSGPHKSAHKISSSTHQYDGLVSQNKFYQTNLDQNLIKRKQHQIQSSKTSLRQSRQKSQNEMNLQQRYKQNFASLNYYGTTNAVYGFRK